MARVLLMTGVAFAAGAVCAAVPLIVRNHYGHNHIATREIAVLSEARQAAFPVVVMGDSLVELADLPSLCGQRALNAGLAGATVEDLQAFAPRLMAALAARPRLVVIAAGVNDAHDNSPDAATVRRDYAQLIATVRGSGARVVIADVAPVGAPHFADAHVFEAARIERINAELPTLGAPILPVAGALAPDGGALPDAFTDDGVHPNAAGYVRWKAAMATICGRYPTWLSPPAT